MTPFWHDCTRTDSTCGPARLTVLRLPALSAAGRQAAAKACQAHYVSRGWLQKFGRASLETKLATVLPKSKRQRSGDLGEILATEYVNWENWDYRAPVLRLRWKDGRELAMRGDDLVAFNLKVSPVGLLKAEAKSRVTLTDLVLRAARRALTKNKGRPAPFVIAFIVSRLEEAGQLQEARRIDAEASGARLLDKRDLVHLLFVFCGNDPTTLLTNHLNGLKPGSSTQYGVALHCPDHQVVIGHIYREAGHA